MYDYHTPVLVPGAKKWKNEKLERRKERQKNGLNCEEKNKPITWKIENKSKKLGRGEQIGTRKNTEEW